MSISAIGASSAYAAHVRSQQPPPPAKHAAPSPTAPRDPDGDNDGSTGSRVDVRA